MCKEMKKEHKKETCHEAARNTAYELHLSHLRYLPSPTSSFKIIPFDLKLRVTEPINSSVLNLQA